MIHELKQLPCYFEDVISGKKTFEVRKADRPYQVGDLLALNEYDAGKNEYTGNSCLVVVDYILNDNKYCKEGYIVMSIKPRWVGKAAERDYTVPYATKKE